MRADDLPDMTVEELLAADEDDANSLAQDDLDEMKSDYEEMREGALLLLQAASLYEMFLQNQITIKQYEQFIEMIEEIADEKDVQIP